MEEQYIQVILSARGGDLQVILSARGGDLQVILSARGGGTVYTSNTVCQGWRNSTYK